MVAVGGPLSVNQGSNSIKKKKKKKKLQTLTTGFLSDQMTTTMMMTDQPIISRVSLSGEIETKKKKLV